MPPQIVPSEESLGNVACDALVVAAHSARNGPTLSDEGADVDAALEGHLSEYLATVSFKGKVGDTVLVPTLGRLPARAIAVVGLGEKAKVTAADVLHASGTAARKLKDRSIVASSLHEAGDGASSQAAVAKTAEGFILGTYSYTSYKSAPKPAKLGRVLLLGSPSSDAIERGVALADATWLARDLTNEPAESLFPESFGTRAREVADSARLECRVLNHAELEQRGFGGILGVGKGSARPPCLIELRYTPEGAPAAKLALVGKGITFDTGGLSLKDAKNMETMKTDMAGGAAVLGAMSVLARRRLPVEVIGLIAAAENMPSGDAIKPGDVIRHYGGKTSEVLNTDAEGRLVLADAIAYACEQGVDAIINIATLTGAIMVALGRKATGLFSNNRILRAEVEAAAAQSGERVWPMPVYDDYRSDLDSEVADIKNIGTRYGGSIFAALFLREFVEEGVPWAHLDIAGPARAEADYDEILKGGTGVATRTLLEWIEKRSSL